MKRKIKIYLACPYTFNPKLGFKASNKIAGDLIKRGFIVFSPLNHSHPIWSQGHQDINHKVWLKQDHEFIKWCDEIYIVIIGEKGYDLIKSSTGVQRELAWGKEYKKVIREIKYEN